MSQIVRVGGGTESVCAVVPCETLERKGCLPGKVAFGRVERLDVFGDLFSVFTVVAVAAHEPRGIFAKVLEQTLSLAARFAFAVLHHLLNKAQGINNGTWPSEWCG